MGRDEERTLAGLKSLRKTLLDPSIATHRGRIVKTTGDGMLVEFASAVDAARCAVEVQRGMAAQNAEVPQEAKIEFRIGMHVGDIIIDDNDIFGDGVNIAARLEGIAEPGGVCISDDAQRQIRGKVETAFEDMGPQALKNIAEPMRAWRLRLSNNAAAAARATFLAETSQPLALPDKPSIAVLPFHNMSGDPEQEYFTDGMVEDIITGLSRFKSLFVIARNSSFTYKGKAVDVKRVGRELGVRYVVEGSVRKAANRLRITGQLIDASTGGHLWADHFDGGLEEVFELQDRVTASVIGAIAPKLEQAETERAMRKPTESLDAYDCFLRGMARFHLVTADGFREARQLFQRATELDPTYAAPYGMAAYCVLFGRRNGWLADLERETAEGVRLARRAAAIGKDDPTALWSSAMCLASLASEVETGISLIDHAILLNANLAMAWSVSGWLRAYVGEHADAIERFGRAIRLSPLDRFAALSYVGIGFAHLFVGRYDEAASWARRAMLDQPDMAAATRVAAIANALSGKIVEAQEAMARLRAIDPQLRLSNLERVAPPLRRPEDRALFIEGLRRAGLPQ